MAVDPYLAAINAGSNVLGKALTTPQAAPSSSMQANPYTWGFDSSGWNVNFGNGTVSSAASKTQATGTGAAAALNWQYLVLAGLGLVALWAARR